MNIRIIELLEMIANGEQPPKKIVWRNTVYIYDEDDYYTKDCDDAIFDYHEITEILNEDVLILETTIAYKPDKIEKLENVEDFKFAKLIDKINEIIDYINKEV